MIPVMIINESGESFNYFEGVGKDDFKDTHVIRGTRCEIRFNDGQLRDKVLELLHKEVARCFYDRQIITEYDSGKAKRFDYKLEQVKFQIYLKDIVEKAKGEKG